MKTSVTQFEMLVSFMEQHGDLNKPTKNEHGRIQAIQDWDNLTNILNSDPTGDNKTAEKWKKVWSDLKNNTKKKAAKINRATCGTGGGPALNLKLSHLEQRVLNIMGPQVAAGLMGVVEAGLTQAPPASQHTDRTITLPPSPTESQSILAIETIEEPINIIDIWDQPGPSRMPHVGPPGPALPPMPPSPARSASPLPQPQEATWSARAAAGPAPSGHTPRRRRMPARRIADSPRRCGVGDYRT